MWHTLRGRLTVILLLALLPVVVFSTAEAVREVLIAHRQDRTDLQQVAKLVAGEYNLVFNGAFQALAVLEHQPEIEDPSTPDCAVTLARAVAGSFDFSDMFVVNPAGLVVCSSAAVRSPVAPAHADWFRAVQTEQKSVAAGPIASPVDGREVVIAAVPIKLKGVSGTGAVAVSIYRGMLNRIRRLAEVPSDVSFYLLTANMRIMLAPSQAPTTSLPITSADIARARDAGQKAIDIEDASGRPLLVAVVPIADGQVYGLVVRPALVLARGQVLSILGQIILPIMLTAFALFIVWLATERNVVRWVRHLRAITIAYRRGNMKVRTKDMTSAPRELAQLGKTMEEMADAITDREGRLVETLAQKESLLREIHHRVKNNLQIITSLLNLQLRTVETPQEEAILKEVQARVDAIALVHRGISASNPSDMIDLRELLPQLTEQLSRYFSRPEMNLQIASSCDEVLLTVDEAIPFAQLVTESVMGGSKHAYPAGQQSEIKISVTAQGNQATLEVADNGIRQPPSEKESPSRTRMGRSLVAALARQLGGDAEFISENGTKTIVRFPCHRPAREAGNSNAFTRLVT